MKCPKCQKRSGDDWRQCGGSCPMPMSPHYTGPIPEDLTQEMSDDEKEFAYVTRLEKENERLRDRIFDLTFREDMGR